MMLLTEENSTSGTIYRRAFLLALLSTMPQLGAGFTAAAATTAAEVAATCNFNLFKARYPLEGGPPQVKLHVAIIVEDTTRGLNKGSGRRVLFDFLPEEPTALPTALRLLTGQDVQGNLRERELRFLPPGSVCVGKSSATLQEMKDFVAEYPDRLSLISNNCFSFVDAFVERHRLEEEEEGLRAAC